MANAYSSFTTDVNQTKTVFAYIAVATGRPTWSVAGDGHRTHESCPYLPVPATTARASPGRQACVDRQVVTRERASDGDRAGAGDGEVSNAETTA